MVKTLKPGDAAPDFDMSTSDGGRVNLSRFKGRRLVLYFYPKDDTKGCTQEAQEFSALAKAFEAAGASILGVSKDSVASHNKFTAKYGLKLPLASDEDGRTCESYSVWVQKSMYGRTYMGIERSTFLIDGKGRIEAIWRKAKAGGHAAEVLAFIKDS